VHCVCQVLVRVGHSIVIAIVFSNQDSNSSRLLPGSSYSCCIRNLHALVIVIVIVITNHDSKRLSPDLK
jgi:hypothetical protein